MLGKALSSESNTGTNPVVISCVGATSSVNLSYAVKNGVEVENFTSILTIDSVAVTQIPTYLTSISTSSAPSIDPPDGYSWLPMTATITNVDSSEHRIEFESNTEDVAIVMFDNPCIVQFSNQHVGTCLSKADDQPSTTNNLIVDMDFENGYVNAVDGTTWNTGGNISIAESAIGGSKSLLTTGRGGVFSDIDLTDNFLIQFKMTILSWAKYQTNYIGSIMEYGTSNAIISNELGSDGFALQAYSTAGEVSFYCGTNSGFFTGIALNTEYQVQISAENGALTATLTTSDDIVKTVGGDNFTLNSGMRELKIGTTDMTGKDSTGSSSFGCYIDDLKIYTTK